MKRGKVDIKKTIQKRLELRQEQVKKNNHVAMNQRNIIRTTGTPPPAPVKVTLANRDDIRTGMEYNEVIPQFAQKYKKNINVDYDVVIIITSYNRFELVNNLLYEIYSQDTDYKYKVILINDGSTDRQYSVLSDRYPELIYLENNENHGKHGYWKTINKVLEEARKYITNSILQMDDDFLPCKNFLNKLITLYYTKKEESNQVICISYHLYDSKHLHEGRWKLKYWVDGGGLYDIEFIKLINYNIDEIPMSRWEENKNLSTGVWQQVSKKINKMGCFIYKTPVSYVKHLGVVESRMSKKIGDSKMATYKFIDD